jgi:ABC-type phosphate transport system substrate-binding protein
MIPRHRVLRLAVVALFGLLSMAGCGSSSSRTRAPAAPSQSTTTATQGAAGSTTECTIPQNNGGDHDADNNGGPSDGDGCDR